MRYLQRNTQPSPQPGRLRARAAQLRRLRLRISVELVEPTNPGDAESSQEASAPPCGQSTSTAPRSSDEYSKASPSAELPIKLPQEFSVLPRMHRDERFLKRKQARLREAHVIPINELVEDIRRKRGEFVPYVDPDSGGALARVLFVLESPARPAAQGSGMLSPDNDDATAANMWEAYQASGLSRSTAVHWNAVPWFIGDSSHERNVSNKQVIDGHRYICELLDIADGIEVVVAMGKPAQASLTRLRPELERRGIRLIECIHPSPRNNGRGGRELVSRTFSEVLAELDRRGN